MKRKNFYLILIGLVIVGIGSFFLYREQQEARALKFEGYEISTIEERVKELYNEEKTDLAENIPDTELEELETTFIDLSKKDLNRRNKERINKLEVEFLTVQEMLALETSIDHLFVETDIVDAETTIAQVNDLEDQVLTFEMKTKYVDRNIEKLANARKQTNDMKAATIFVEHLFDEEDSVQATVTREDEEEAFELIEPIRNQEIREELLARLEVVSLVLTEREEAIALEAELEALEEAAAEEALEQEETSETESTPPATNWDGSGSNNSGNNTWQPSPAPEPEIEADNEAEETTDPEPELESEPETEAPTAPEIPEEPEEPTEPEIPEDSEDPESDNE